MEAVPATNRIEALLAESEWVGSLALRLVRDEASADELVQETWLAALRRPPAPRGSLRPWLATVLRNAARTERRSGRARAAREAERATGAEEATERAPEELLARLETQELVSRLVRELPEELRDTILLSFFEGVTSDEIARRQGVPAGTVRWRKKRALELLRERLDSRFGGDRNAWLSALMPLATSASREGVAAAGGGVLAGLLAPWFAMSLTMKTVSLLALALLAAVPFVVRGGSTAEPQASAARAIDPPAVPDEPEAAEDPVALRTPARSEPSTAPVDPGDVDPGTPVMTSLRLRVVDENGAPVPDATVKASPSLEMQRRHEELFSGLGALELLSLEAQLEQRTDADGVARWSTDLLRYGGLVDFDVEGPGYSVGELQTAIEPGEEQDLGEVRLRRAGAVLGRARAFGGGSAGKLLVELGPAELPADLERLRRQGPGETSGSARVAGSGEFSMTGVAPGEYRVYTCATPGVECTWSEPFEVVAGQATRGVSIEVVRDASASAELVVLDADGEPLETAYVEASNGGISISGFVNDDGAYRWSSAYSSLAGGRAVVTDRSLRHRRTEVSLPLAPQPVVVRLELADTVGRTLRVTGAGGEAVGSASVRVSCANGTRDVKGFESGDELLLPASSEGPFDLRIDARGFVPHVATGLDAAALPEDWTIALAPLPGIQGVVLADGEPVAGATLELRWKMAPGRVYAKGDEVLGVVDTAADEATTARDGRFRLHQDEDGDFVVLARARGHADAFVELDGYVAASGRAELVVELSKGGVVRGTVYDSAGQPVPRASVVLNHPYYGLRRKRAGRDGSFRLTNVPAGDWYLRRVEAFDSGWMGWTSNVGEAWTYPSNCRVEAGEERVQDLWLPDLEAAFVGGYVELVDSDADDWTVRLEGVSSTPFRGDPFARGWDAQAPLGTGEFFFPVPDDRGYTLTLASESLGLRLSREFSAGELPVELDERIEFARLEARFADTAGDLAGRTLYLGLKDEPWTFHTRLTPDADGRFPSTCLPAGRYGVTWTERGHGNGGDRELELAAGEERTLEL